MALNVGDRLRHDTVTCRRTPARLLAMSAVRHCVWGLAPGAKIGHYAVTAQIGAGGMGEVYRARDTKLDRDVGIRRG